MRSEGDLYDLIEDNVGEPLRLHVYNTETDHVREVWNLAILFSTRTNSQ